MKTLAQLLETCPFKGNRTDLKSIMEALTEGAKRIHKDVNRGGLANIYGAAGSENVQGEAQQKLDIIANDYLIEAMNGTGSVCVIASEEDEDILLTTHPQSPYVFCMDPLDGSSNIDVNISIGTIFCVFERLSPANEQPQLSDVLQKGRAQVLAGYILYSTATVLVFTTGAGVYVLGYDTDKESFIMVQEGVQIPENGKIYSCNEGNMLTYSAQVRGYLSLCKSRKYSARYIGSLVADFHRNMLKGGLFMYPSTEKDKNGKLRLLYECNPLAWIAEQAGGSAKTPEMAVLDVQPEKLHQRIPFFIGSKNMVQEALSI